jgi:hypothetical protein
MSASGVREGLELVARLGGAERRAAVLLRRERFATNPTRGGS